MEQENCIQFACFMVKSKEKEFKDKRPMDHIAHLRNKHIWANLWLPQYYNVDWEKKKKLYPFWGMNVPYL